MKNTLMLTVLLFARLALADDWLCKEESSERRGDSILACGIGESQSEPKARALALQAAKREFQEICDSSSDCKGRGVIVTPRRTECRDGRCYRLVSFQIQSERTQTRPTEALHATTPWKQVNTDSYYSNANTDIYAEVHRRDMIMLKSLDE